MAELLPNGKSNYQFNRVVFVMSKHCRFMTLTEIKQLIFNETGEHDSECAISARWREVNPVRDRVIKHVQITKNPRTGKRCWLYKLEPML